MLIGFMIVIHINLFNNPIKILLLFLFRAIFKFFHAAFEFFKPTQKLPFVF
jgi:hypothetical protein